MGYGLRAVVQVELVEDVADVELHRVLAHLQPLGELARDLRVSENTVKFHVRNILDKLHLHNRAQVVGYALRHRLVESPPQ